MSKNTNDIPFHRKLLLFLLPAIVVTIFLLILRFNQEIPKRIPEAQTVPDEAITDDSHQFPNETNLTEDEILFYGYSFPTLNINVRLFPLENSFVAIYRYNNTSGYEFIAASDLLSGGTVQTSTINTNGLLHEGDQILIEMFGDNGNGVFDENSDRRFVNEKTNKYLDLVELHY